MIANIQRVKLTEFKFAAQTRAALSPETLQQYIDIIEGGEDLEPAVAFKVGKDLILSAGHHRREAYERAGKSDMPCEIRVGSLWDAVEFSLLSNRQFNGARLTRADRQEAIKMALIHGHNKSNRFLASLCGSSDKTVAERRSEMEATCEIPHVVERVGLDGKSYELAKEESRAEESSLSTTTASTICEPKAAQEEKQAESGSSATLTVQATDTMSVTPAAEQPETQKPRKSREVLELEAEKALGAFARAIDNLKAEKEIDYGRHKSFRFLIETVESFLEESIVTDGNQVIEQCELALVSLATGLDKMKQFDRAGGVKGMEHAFELGQVLRGAKGRLSRPAATESDVPAGSEEQLEAVNS